MLGTGWQRPHDERRPQRVAKINSRSASGTTASASEGQGASEAHDAQGCWTEAMWASEKPVQAKFAE